MSRKGLLKLWWSSLETFFKAISFWKHIFEQTGPDFWRCRRCLWKLFWAQCIWHIMMFGFPDYHEKVKIWRILDIFENYNQGNLKLVDNAKSKIIAYSLGLFLKLISIFYFENYKLVLIIYSLEISLSYFLIYTLSYILSHTFLYYLIFSYSLSHIIL